MDKVKHALQTVLAVGLLIPIFAGAIYVSLWWQMAGYSDLLKCNPNTGITRIEWFFGVRPSEDCRR